MTDRLFPPGGPRLTPSGWPVDPYVLQAEDFIHGSWVAFRGSRRRILHAEDLPTLPKRTRACLGGWALMTFGFSPHDGTEWEFVPRERARPLLTFLRALLTKEEQQRFLRKYSLASWTDYFAQATGNGWVPVYRLRCHRHSTLLWFVSDVFEACDPEDDYAARWSRALQRCGYAV